MVRFRVTINSQSSIYLPEPIREELGTNTLELLGDAKAIILYPKGTDLDHVLRSIQILALDLEHRRDLEKLRIASEARTASSSRRSQQT